MAAPASPLRPLFTTAPLYPYATSPLSTHLSHSHSDSYYFAPSPCAPAPHPSCPSLRPEPLSFAKVPVPRSSTSTDSEALSDGYLSRSPSLLTSLLRGSSTSSSAAPYTPVAGPGGAAAAGSILRRPSGASDDWRAAATPAAGAPPAGHGLGLVTVPEQDRAGSSVEKVGVSDAPVVMGNAVAGPSCSRVLGRRKSCLTFAVTSATRASPPALVPKTHAAPPSPVARLPSVGEPEMDDDDEGYEEDSEDGLSSASDDDADDHAVVDAGALYRPSFAQPAWAPGTFAPPILRAAPRRRGTAPAEMSFSSTETDEAAASQAAHAPHARRSVVRIRAGARPAERCSRHRSPPPSAVRALSPEPAPPAARSPSAAELCRRRQGCPSLSRDVPAAPAPRRRATASDLGARPFGPCLAVPAVRPILRAAESEIHSTSMRREVTGLPGGAAVCGAPVFAPVFAPAFAPAFSGAVHDRAATAPTSPRLPTAAGAARQWRMRAASVADYQRRGSAPARVGLDVVCAAGRTQRAGDAVEALRRGSR